MTNVYQWHSVEDLIDGVEGWEDCPEADAFRVEQFKPIDWTNVTFHNGVMVEEVKEIPPPKSQGRMMTQREDDDLWDYMKEREERFAWMAANDATPYTGPRILPRRKWWEFWK